MLNPPILSLPREGLRYSLDTDACDDQIGWVLFQTNEDGERKPLGYWSKALKPAERNYSVTEKECLAVVQGILTCRPYLYGERFDLYTDHHSLRWLMSIDDPSGRLMRWRLRLAEYDFEIYHKKGRLNNQGDALSRLRTNGYVEVENDIDIPGYDVCALTRSQRCSAIRVALFWSRRLLRALEERHLGGELLRTNKATRKHKRQEKNKFV